jgi:aminoglycoside phosphotransferase
VTGSPTEPKRLCHGYTNATTVEGRRVVKRYLGPDAPERRSREVRAPTLLAGRFPVPPLIESDESQVVLAFVPGVHGQEILEERPEEILFEVGRAGRTLHELDLRAAYEGADGSVLLHGDFGPQNMLFDEGTLQMQALVDWEFTHAGDPVEDLAWAEWIVRTHHPHLAKALDALFAGYGHRPTWQRRQNAMLDKCRWALDVVRRWSATINATSVAMWEQRLEATARFRE